MPRALVWRGHMRGQQCRSPKPQKSPWRRRKPLNSMRVSFLPPGSYSGIKAWVREDALGGLISTPSRFRIELTAEQLGSMGATVQPNQNSEEIDVTEFVRLGLLKPI